MHSLSRQSRNKSAVHKSVMNANAIDKISTESNKAIAHEFVQYYSLIIYWIMVGMEDNSSKLFRMS